jgi:uracil-DNA glycosylase family 4
MDAWQILTEDIITCRACPRLVAWREQVAHEKRRAYWDWDYWGRPVPGFGDPQARLLIVGLAPGAHGSNRTGRMFTGDSSGDTLYAALHRAGLASQPTARHAGDGLKLTDTFITAVVRCAPPDNRPTREELATCQPFLAREWALMPQVCVVLALGHVAFDGCVRLLYHAGYPASRLKFGHGLHYALRHSHPAGSPPHSRGSSHYLGGAKHLIASYHPSRQNTQTGRLTPAMLDEVLGLAKSLLVCS